MNPIIPLVCSVVIPKEDYPKYVQYLEEKKTDPKKWLPYGMHLYRVTHHLKEIPIDNHLKYRARLQYCIPEEATWLSGAGVSGILCPISDVVMVESQVNWSENMIARERKNAISDFWLQPDRAWDLRVNHDGKLIVV